MNADGRSARHKPEPGFALILVLWFLVLIAAIGTYIMASGRTETAIARNIRSAATAEALADAGIAQAVFNLTNPDIATRWTLDGSPHLLKLATGEVTIRLYDENAKINPNSASDMLLAALFESVGVDRSQARRLGAAVADWVSSQPKKRPLGAKLEEYQRAGRSYGPPNAAVDSLDELQLVLGMTPEIFAAVRPYLTIYTESDKPDPKNASLVVLQALQLAVRAAPRDAASERAAEASGAEPSDPDAPDMPDETDDTMSEAESAMAAEQPPPVIDVEVTAQATSGGVYARHAVLKLQPENAKGYMMLDWWRADLAE